MENKTTGTINPSWLDPNSIKYKPWASISTNGGTRIYCTWCNKDLLIDSLYGATGHLRNPEHVKNQQKWDDEQKSSNLPDLHLNKIKLFEIDLYSLLIQLNLPFSSVDPILEFIKKYAHSAIVQNSSLTRKKAAELIKFEIEEKCVQKVQEKLEKTNFSIIIDEVSDISKKKFFAIMVQYFDESEGIVCKLLALKECSL